MIYLQLFLSYLKIGFFGFGGGYAMLSLIQNEIVVRHAWLTGTELTDIIAVSQMTPGPIAINSATYVGYAVTGSALGSFLATFAVCLPPLTLMVAITIFYNKLRSNRILEGALRWMKPMLCGMIGAAALMFLNRETFIDWTSVAIFAACFAATWFKVDSILLIVLAAAAGILLY
ncbi:MAG: chromate transporter [Bacteroidales bacterium]|nr:chromate transporter [Candidatus Cacconaster merdequi]